LFASLLILDMLQVPAKRARTRERGEQRSALLSEKQPDGSYRTSDVQRKLHVATRKLKRQTAKLNKVQGLLSAAGAREEVNVAAAFHRKRKHTDIGATYSARNLALAQTSQHLHSLNHTLVNATRSTGRVPLARYERGEFPERSSVQRAAMHFGLGASDLLMPKSDKIKACLPLVPVLEELMRVSGFDANGVAVDARGRYDMANAPVFGVAGSCDGAELNKKGGGFQLLVLKPWDASIARTMTGRPPAGPGDNPYEGQQSASASIAMGWLRGTDNVEHNME
jgi:hypothetical protein